MRYTFLGDLVPKGCEEWDLFIISLKICSIAASWQIKSNTISYLEILIEELHTKSIIPKMHYMVRYLKQIVLYGPLEYSWTMRHEAKLSVIKRSSSHGNFKNICYTQTKFACICYHINCKGPFLTKPWEIASTSTHALVMMSHKSLWGNWVTTKIGCHQNAITRQFIKLFRCFSTAQTQRFIYA